jgi:shikimate dehydrogenase
MRRMYFIGVSTGASSIHRVFPQWTRLAGIDDAMLTGIDIPIEGTPAQYRAAIQGIREDPDAWGALVTTHKVAIYAHARDIFTALDADAELLGEVSCIVRRDDRLTGIAIDTLTAALALPAVAPTLILGAGGAGLALAVHLDRAHPATPVTITDISPVRLDLAGKVASARTVLVSGPEDHDRLLETMPPGSLVVNATGRGKDRPGSPITAVAKFPLDAIAWDFNYRGELLFLDYARSQGIRAVDGWEYFLHGWSQIMARVLGFDLTAELLESMKMAANERK